MMLAHLFFGLPLAGHVMYGGSKRQEKWLSSVSHVKHYFKYHLFSFRIENKNMMKINLLFTKF